MALNGVSGIEPAHEGWGGKFLHVDVDKSTSPARLAFDAAATGDGSNFVACTEPLYTDWFLNVKYADHTETSNKGTCVDVTLIATGVVGSF